MNHKFIFIEFIVFELIVEWLEVRGLMENDKKNVKKNIFKKRYYCYFKFMNLIILILKCIKNYDKR